MGSNSINLYLKQTSKCFLYTNIYSTQTFVQTLFKHTKNVILKIYEMKIKPPKLF